MKATVGRWQKVLIIIQALKFGDGDRPNFCRVYKADVSFTFIENIFRSGLTLVSSNDIITIKNDIFFVKNHKKINKQKRLFKQIMRWKKR